jgi:four helix bundle protein
MTNDQAPMTKASQRPRRDGAGANAPSDEPTFDLAERTARFGECVIRFLQSIKPTAVRAPILSQLVRSATSIGANYCEADEASSRKEFRYRIGVCCRECRETRFWIRMLVVAVPEIKVEARTLWKEADEMNRIFATIVRRTKPSA